MIHRIPDEWLIEIETKLHLASLKNEKLGNRLNKIIAGIERIRQNQVEILKDDTSTQIKPNFIDRIKLKIKSRG